MTPTKLIASRLGFALLSFAFSQPTFSQTQLSAGAESAGLADVRIGLKNVWTAYNNPADMVSDSQLRIGVFVDNPFNVQALQSTAISCVYNRRNFAVGVYYHHFGYRVSRQEQVGISAGLTISQKSAIGVTASALRSTFGNVSFPKRWSIGAGFSQQLTKNATLHLWTANPIVAKEQEVIQSLYIGGIRMDLSAEMRWIIQSAISPTAAPNISSGFQYQVMKAITVNFGFNTSPRMMSFGFEVSRNQWSITSAHTHHHLLGFSPQISAQWSN